MYSVLAGTFVLVSIAILIAHAMEGLSLISDPSGGHSEPQPVVANLDGASGFVQVRRHE